MLYLCNWNLHSVKWKGDFLFTHVARNRWLFKATAKSDSSYLQGSTELASHALPEIAKLLTDQDEMVVLEASKILHELSKKEPSCRALVANGTVVSMLIQAMASTASAEIQKSLSGTLHNLSNDQ